MRLDILGAESLGARGLCCRIETRDRVVVVDPGVALGAWRHGLPPHPVQVAAGREVRHRIVAALRGATDVVFSHYHGDHVPLLDPNPYQLGLRNLPAEVGRLRAWGLSPSLQTAASRARAADLMEFFGARFEVAEGRHEGDLCFSAGVPHGRRGPSAGDVMLTRLDVGGRVFVHASDIQLLSASTVDLVLDWEPHWVLAAGAALYQEALGPDDRRAAWANAVRLAEGVSTLILDHHLLRSLEGAAWLDRLSTETGRRVQCAADVMGRPRRLLEARRRGLYHAMPVRAGWHEAYARGRATVDDFGPSR